MLDLDLLRSFVSVVDAGGFTRAGERVHRTQSTVSQQIRKLEQAVGRPLLHRQGRGVAPTEEGERLLGYARRLLALSDEAEDALRRPDGMAVVRVGLGEDFAAERLTEALSGLARLRPALRLDVRCDAGPELRRAFGQGELDIAVIKRDAGIGTAFAAWPERLVWVASRRHGVPEGDPVPLVAYAQGCIYRARAIHALESAGRRWRIAFTGSNLSAVQAAIACGFGIGILVARSVRDDLRILRPEEGFPPVPPSELAVMLQPGASPAVRLVAEQLAESCAEARPEAA
ncbi:LysR substrate-binding domain-containing protein [Inquilinus sp. Marseille-Q2685]|uniref:LysR substrate-binding domain-containing protein n=1 Tax=Inquilinus sp. Marseille-Q2685 TaxID=2866581 RepID=UPI001CE47EDC|nr:LysR substrate-binding domain-containing protein [Inquilinus sp. Marseille-Q2685]